MHPGVEPCVDALQGLLLKNLEQSISGYFYKRKSFYFDKKDQLKTNTFLGGLLSKIKLSKYDKRFFKLDLKSLTFSYSKDRESINTQPLYQSSLRNLKSVKRNIVSMPFSDKDGQVKFRELSILDTNDDVDRGPTPQCRNVCEVKIGNRLLTLYCESNSLMENFVLYIEKILEL